METRWACNPSARRHVAQPASSELRLHADFRAPFLQAYLQEELDKWSEHGVEGHFKPVRPWVSIDETVEAGSARIVGASPEEVVIMNTLTTNLHLLMVSFYTPTSTRYKIIVEGKAFPSDAVRGRGGTRLNTYVRRVTPHLLRCPVCVPVASEVPWVRPQ